MNRGHCARVHATGWAHPVGGAADLLPPSKLSYLLASGRPIVVTTRRESERDCFREGICTLTPPGDGAALARAILEHRDAAPTPWAQVARPNKAASLAKHLLLPLFVGTALFSPDPINEQAHVA